jgi:uncharacterized protein (TIGR02246 family)
MSTLDAIKTLIEDYEAAHQAGDGQALARMFWDDAIIIPPGKPAITGREEIDKFFGGVKGGAGLKTETSRIEVDGSLAYDYGTASWTENGDKKRLYYVDIYRLEDGEWKMQLSSWNSNEGISE